MSNLTPEQEAVITLAKASQETLPWEGTSTADTIGLHAIWVELIKLNNSSERDIFFNAKVNPEEKRLEVKLESEHSDISEFLTEWLGKIEKISHAPSGWELVVFLMSEPIKMRSERFPQWHDISE